MPTKPPTLRPIGLADYRQQAKRWYASARWRKRRAAQLKAQPLCEDCEADGRAVEATVADHDPPHRGSVLLFFNGPLRSLCISHHNRKSAKGY